MFGFGNPLGMGNPFMRMAARDFDVRLRCYSAPFYPAGDSKKIKELNFGGKILLPNSALDNLTRLNIQYPMLFKITSMNVDAQRATHAGVLEFSAEEGKCYLPAWMMRQLMINEGEMAVIEYQSLPSATYAKFKPMSTDFLNISNPRAMLEVELRKFACLTKGDVIAVEYNEQVLEFKVMDLKPGNAVTIIECDMNVEFDAPEGYVEPNYAAARKPDEMPPAPEVQPAKSGFSAFSGEGMRLDGKAVKPRQMSSSSLSSADASGSTPIAAIVPREDYQPGSLTFVRYNYRNRAVLQEEARKKALEAATGARAFSGAAQTVRDRR
ncbi:ubiquitin fusion degradation protein UFD1 containing protein [Aphelenchoides avenae]|nr:ubiquitin fusion degradation protein UFD1 containing protein [Aphelenchus avenae]